MRDFSRREFVVAPGTIARVKGSAADPYELRVGQDANFYCTCPSWRFQKLPPKLRECKHMRAYIAVNGRPVLGKVHRQAFVEGFE